MNELIVAQALEWFLAARANEITGQRREDFIDWLRASPAHVREYLALTGFTADLKTVASEFQTPTEVLIERARSEPDIVHALRPAATPASKPRRFSTWAAAASVLITVIVIGVFSVWRLYDQNSYSTAHAEQRSWRMPDGSTVHLNSGSKIRIRFDERRRAVELLRGQALFQVAKDAHRPFSVHAGEATVEAVGTEFDVYKQPQLTVISVVEGRVAVWGSPEPVTDAAESPTPVTQLEAGQQARIDRTSTAVSGSAAEVRKTVAWLQRQVVFDHDPLVKAAAEFNRYSETHIRIDDEVLQATEISGIFSAYDTEAFIRFLEMQPDVQVTRTREEVIVTPR